MAEQKINQLVGRLVRILKKNDNLSGMRFQKIGEIFVYDPLSEMHAIVTYDPSDILEFLDAYENAVEERHYMELQRKGMVNK